MNVKSRIKRLYRRFYRWWDHKAFYEKVRMQREIEKLAIQNHLYQFRITNEDDALIRECVHCYGEICKYFEEHRVEDCCLSVQWLKVAASRASNEELANRITDIWFDWMQILIRNDFPVSLSDAQPPITPASMVWLLLRYTE